MLANNKNKINIKIKKFAEKENLEYDKIGEII